MSISTFSGILFSLGLFFTAIKLSTDNWAVFLSLSSFLLVFGGSLARTFIAFETRSVLRALKFVLMIMAIPSIGRNALKLDAERIIEWGRATRKNGIQALESEAKNIKGDAFLKLGLDLVNRDYTGEEISAIMSNTAERAFKRNMEPVKALNSLAASAPAFGFIGTLIGVVIMLGKMGGDPASLSKGLALAMITTLYGMVLAHLIYKPCADKITQREQAMRLRNYMVTDGLSMLAEHKSPQFIKDKMNSYLNPAAHCDLDTAEPMPSLLDNLTKINIDEDH